MSATTTDFQPWEAYVLDADGYVIPDEHVRGWVTAVKDGGHYDLTDSTPDEIVIVRGGARPTPQSQGSEFLRAPGTYRERDHLIPAIDISSDDAVDIETLWDRAVRIADAANHAAIQ